MPIHKSYVCRPPLFLAFNANSKDFVAFRPVKSIAKPQYNVEPRTLERPYICICNVYVLFGFQSRLLGHTLGFRTAQHSTAIAHLFFRCIHMYMCLTVIIIAVFYQNVKRSASKYRKTY